MPLREYEGAVTDKKLLDIENYTREEVEEYVKKSGGKIIAGKGATFYGIAASVCHIVKNIYSGADTVATVSTLMEGEYGVSDVGLSTLCLLGRDGVKTTLTPTLTDEEVAKFQNSAKVLKDVIAQIEI